MMDIRPPKWADRFLTWYCNPDLLEEIQGDAHELYFDRVKKEGKSSADRKYIWDVIRFCRWSNIKRTENTSGFNKRTVWNFNFKIAFRNATHNKLIFAIKISGLSICIAFALLLMAFAVNELMFDEFHLNRDRIYRITSKVSFEDHVTHYAVTPLPIGNALTQDIPEVENYFRFMYEDKPVFHIEKDMYYDEVTLAADSNFLKILTFNFLYGNNSALNEPNTMVLTRSLAIKFFGDANVLGRTIKFGHDILLEVSAVIQDVPSNSHVKFDALISWDTFDRNDDWGNLNAYTYILLKPDAIIQDVKTKMPSVLATFHEMVAREYKATFEPIIEKITDIHFSEYLDEDIAEKKSESNVFIMAAIVLLFLITGLINYLNLTLAELTANLKRIGILKIFGGMAGDARKILLFETLFSLSLVVPIALLLGYLGWTAANNYLSINLNPSVFVSPLFMAIAGGFICVIILCSQLNSLVLSRVSYVVNSLRGKLSIVGSGTRVRKILVGVQMSFSIIMIALIFIIVDQFQYIEEADKGFDDKHTIVVKLRSHSPRQAETFMESVRKMSGVSKVDGSSYFPGVIETKYVFQVETEKGMEQLLVPMITCGYDYLDALNVKMAKGRGFEVGHAEDSFGSFVINETAAREFGWNDPIGKRISGPESGQGDSYRKGNVIGVVKDFNFTSLHNKIEPLILFLTDDNWGSPFIYIKTNPIHANDLISIIGKEFKLQWPEHPFEWEYLDAKYMSLYRKDYEVKNMFEIGLVISVLISCLGIFSVSALLTTLRTKEMGIRKVVGASSLQLFLLHTKTFLQFLIVSVLAAWPVIWYLSDKWLQNFAYHITLSIGYFIVPAIIAMFITIVTSGYHGVKSALVNPVDILKDE